jgi:hypothetical protein
VLQREPNPPLLLAPGIGQGLGEASDREVRRCGSIDDSRNDARRQKGKRDEQADVPFTQGLALGDLDEGVASAEPDFVDPFPGLGDCGQQSIASLGFIAGFAQGA